MSFQLFYQCQVLDVNDPLMLGRIRGRRLIDNYDDILKGISDPPWNEQTDIWTERDPFVFQPLLPYFVYQTPKADEMVLVMYLTSDVKFINQYYIQTTFYSPTSSNFQFYQGGNKFTGTGIQIANPRPLKNLDGTYTDKAKHYGVFPEPGDNSLLGRGSADVIVKENDVLIRAGKFKGSQLKPNVVPSANQLRSFLQLSRFDKQRTAMAPKTYSYIKQVNLGVKYLIEYHITNPENTYNMFNGYVFLYQLKLATETTSNSLTVNSVIPSNLKTMVTMENFFNLSKVGVVDFINNFIKICNSSNVSPDGTVLFASDQKFPIYYRPQADDYKLMMSQPTPQPQVNTNYICTGTIYEMNGQCSLTIEVNQISPSQNIITNQGTRPCSEIRDLYNDLMNETLTEITALNLGYILIPTLDNIIQGTPPESPEPDSLQDGTIQSNLSEIFNQIKLNAGTAGGYGLIWKKDNVGTPINIEKREEAQSDVKALQNTVAALGGDKLYLLSHLSAVPGKKKINFDNTLYGISEETFFKEIEPNTSSSVRGEELLTLLNLIVEFLLTHVHPFPGKAPLPVTRSLMLSSTLKNAMQNATNTILNTNIRLN